MKLQDWNFTCTVAFAALSAVSLPALHAQANAVVGDELRNLVSGKSWALSTYGDPTNPATTMVWDFRSDGTVCARFVNSRVGEKCADVGKWNLRDNLLCWDLTWFGGSAGIKTACNSVKRSGPDRVHLHSDKAPELTFMVVHPL